MVLKWEKTDEVFDPDDFSYPSDDEEEHKEDDEE